MEQKAGAEGEAAQGVEVGTGGEEMASVEIARSESLSGMVVVEDVERARPRGGRRAGPSAGGRSGSEEGVGGRIVSMDSSSLETLMALSARAEAAVGDRGVDAAGALSVSSVSCRAVADLSWSPQVACGSKGVVGAPGGAATTGVTAAF